MERAIWGLQLQDSSKKSRTSIPAKPKTTWHLRDVPPSTYRLPADGRKWRVVCDQRRALAAQLATHADPDGSNIWVRRLRLAEALGHSVREVGYLLADLVTLKFLRDDGWHGQNRKRMLDLEAIFQSWRSGAAANEIRVGDGQDRADRGHGQNRRHGQNSAGPGQNSSGTLPPVVNPPKPTPPNPPFSKGGTLLTRRDRKRLNDEIWWLQDNHPTVQLEEAVQIACAKTLISLDQAWATLETCGLGEARKKRAQRATA